MRVQTDVVKIGNSWGIRLPKTVLELSGIKQGAKLELEVRPGRLILRLPGHAADGKLDQTYKDLKAVWDEALDDTWFQLFGPDYD